MKYLFLALGLVITFRASCQQRTEGYITDAQTREPLSGATVRALHSSGGAVSKAGGRFMLPAVSVGDTLSVSCVGYKPGKIVVTKSPVFIVLQPAPSVLNGLVVSASRELRPRAITPLAISIISPQVLEETKAVTLDQVLNKVSGVYMVDLGNEQHTMAIRQPIGYRSTFLYLEDGIPVRATGDFNHNALIEINSAAVKRIEVIRGPSSSLYGSDAIGGAVNFITKSPALTPTAAIQLEGSDNGYRRADFNASGTFDKTGLYIGGYYAGQRNGYMDHSDFDKLAVTAKVTRSLDKKTGLTLASTWVDYKTDQTGGLDSAHFYGQDFRSFYTFTYRKVHALRLRGTAERRWDPYNHSQLTLYFRNNSIAQNPFYAIKDVAGNPLKARGEINDDAFASFGLIAQHSKRFEQLHTKWITGLQFDYSPARYLARYIDISRNAAGYYTDYVVTDSVLTDYHANLFNTAAYTQLEVAPVRRLEIVAALRYDRLDYLFDNHLPPSAFTGAPDAANAFHQVTPKIGLTYDLEKGRGIYVNYSRGFAPPDINDLYRGVKVPYLQPATYANYEAGGWTGFAGGKGYGEASLYWMEGRNEIISVHLPDNSYENANAGRTRHIGLEYTLKYNPSDQWSLRFSGTTARHRFVDYVEKGKDYSGKEMNTAPRFIANASAAWTPSFFPGFRMSLEWQHVSRYFMDEANTKYYKGYHTLNARLRYKIRRFEVWAHVINLANATYAVTADKTAYGENYRPGPLRTFYLGVGYRFEKQEHDK